MTQSRENPDSPESNESIDYSPSQFLTRDSVGDAETGNSTSEIPKRNHKSDLRMNLFPPDCKPLKKPSILIPHQQRHLHWKELFIF